MISFLIIFFQAREITSGERLISADFSPLEPTCAIMAVSQVIKNRLLTLKYTLIQIVKLFSLKDRNEERTIRKCGFL